MDVHILAVILGTPIVIVIQLVLMRYNSRVKRLESDIDRNQRSLENANARFGSMSPQDISDMYDRLSSVRTENTQLQQQVSRLEEDKRVLVETRHSYR